MPAASVFAQRSGGVEVRPLTLVETLLYRAILTRPTLRPLNSLGRREGVRC